MILTMRSRDQRVISLSTRREKNARELASFKLSVLSSAKTIELYRFSRRLSCNPSPALIIFSGFSPLNCFEGESYLVMSRNLKREIWSHYEIPAFHKIKPCLQMIMFDKHKFYIARLSHRRNRETTRRQIPRTPSRRRERRQKRI